MICENDPNLFDFSNNSTLKLILALVNFQKFYSPIHGRICIVLCAFGIVTNLLHCLILTRPTMRSSAVNCIMTAIALCDLGTMASYFVYIIHFVLWNSSNSCSNNYTKLWMHFLLLHMFFSITLHTTTLWLAVWMAFLRRLSLVRRNLMYSKWQCSKLALQSSMVVAALVFILSLPSFFALAIVEYKHDIWRPKTECQHKYPSNYTEPIYTIVVSSCLAFKATLWLTGIIFKVIPCTLLLILSISLMQKLRKAEKNRRRLVENGLTILRPSAAGEKEREERVLVQKSSTDSKKNSSDRTTPMLLAILIVFILTEFPQGALTILNAVYTTDVHSFIYLTLGDLLDLLSLVNSSVNFVLYCLMSSRYRQTFCAVLMPLSLKRWLSSSNSNFACVLFLTNCFATEKSNKATNGCHGEVQNKLPPFEVIRPNATTNCNRNHWMAPVDSKRKRPPFNWAIERQPSEARLLSEKCIEEKESKGRHK